MIRFCIPYFFHCSRRPSVGDKIHITWFPYNNGFPDKNIYIGSEGVVIEVYNNGGFTLDTRCYILVVSKGYRYKIIK